MLLTTLSDVVIELATDRFCIRTLVPEDVGNSYASWFTDATVHDFITWRPSRDAVAELSQYVAVHHARDDSLLLGVFEPSTGHVANIKYEPVDFARQTAVLGILVGNPAWRSRGLFQEVFLASSAWLKDAAGIRRIELGVDQSNVAAIAAYERAGFHYEDLDENLPSRRMVAGI